MRRFPPTTEAQFDEKRSFVCKKEANCDRSDPADDHKGDYRDHAAYDPEHRLVISVVPGARTIEDANILVEDFRKWTGGRLMALMTSGDYPAYETAVLHASGETVVPPHTGGEGRPRAYTRPHMRGWSTPWWRRSGPGGGSSLSAAGRCSAR